MHNYNDDNETGYEYNLRYYQQIKGGIKKTKDYYRISFRNLIRRYKAGNYDQTTFKRYVLKLRDMREKDLAKDYVTISRLDKELRKEEPNLIEYYRPLTTKYSKRERFNYSHITENLARVESCFPGAFIKLNEELILNREYNVYFRLENIETPLDFDCKMLAWVARPAHKEYKNKKQIIIKQGLNAYFGRDWSNEDLSIIYTKLGNGCNGALCKTFIEADFDLGLLKRDY
jgi:hypothetical protein